MTARTVLVTNGEQRSSLAVVRSLGRMGHRVLVASSRPHSLAGASRFASAEFVLASPLRDPDGFVAGIAGVCEREHVEVVIPTTDDALLALLPAREQLRPAVLPIGPEEAYRAASDKAVLQGIAPEFGIAVPRQVVACSADQPGLNDLHLPVAIKPSRSVSSTNAGIVRNVGVRYANNAAELRQILSEAAPESFPLLVQERIVGEGIGVFLLLWEGKRVAAFSHRRLREKPPSGGVSVYCESIALDPDLVNKSEALLSKLGFEGVAMVEYKVNGQTGVPYLMEVNGRFWGSTQLAIDAGVDFPQLLMNVAVDGVIPSQPTPEIGVRSRWWWGEFDHLLLRLRRSPQELGLAPGAPTRWEAVRAFFRRHGSDRNQIFRLDDPGPALRETIDWFRRR